LDTANVATTTREAYKSVRNGKSFRLSKGERQKEAAGGLSSITARPINRVTLANRSIGLLKAQPGVHSNPSLMKLVTRSIDLSSPTSTVVSTLAFCNSEASPPVSASQVRRVIEETVPRLVNSLLDAEGVRQSRESSEERILRQRMRMISTIANAPTVSARSSTIVEQIPTIQPALVQPPVFATPPLVVTQAPPFGLNGVHFHSVATAPYLTRNPRYPCSNTLCSFRLPSTDDRFNALNLIEAPNHHYYSGPEMIRIITYYWSDEVRGYETIAMHLDHYWDVVLSTLTEHKSAKGVSKKQFSTVMRWILFLLCPHRRRILRSPLADLNFV
jgi:hypothetical protein